MEFDFGHFSGTLVSEMADAVIYADAEGRIRFWNSGAERIFGFARDEASGQSLDIIIPEPLRRRHWDGFHETVRNRPSAVLPTIVSRCQILRFSYLSPDEISTEFCSRLSVDPSDPRLKNVIHTGSLGRSLYLWDHPADDVRKESTIFWNLCLRKDWQELAGYIDHLSEQGDYALFERLFTELMQCVRNAFLRELGGTENIFLGDRSSTVDLQGITSHTQVEKLSELCERSIAAVRAHANITLVLAQFAIVLTEALHGEKQQPR